MLGLGLAPGEADQPPVAVLQPEDEVAPLLMGTRLVPLPGAGGDRGSPGGVAGGIPGDDVERGQGRDRALSQRCRPAIRRFNISGSGPGWKNIPPGPRLAYIPYARLGDSLCHASTTVRTTSGTTSPRAGSSSCCRNATTAPGMIWVSVMMLEA